MGFLLKRKRSDSELSATSSQFSSPPRQDMFSVSSMADIDFCSPTRPRASTPSHLPSRTMKRFRNNRPSEEEVHRHTLGLLYKAQNTSPFLSNQHQRSTASLFPPPVESPSAPVSKPQCQQSSLHRFFNISGSAPSSTASSIQSVVEIRRCEDCGLKLCGSDGDDAVMDVDRYGFETGSSDFGCVACGRVVCSHCSVSNLGDQRRCLVCAGQKTVGIGWSGVC